MDFEEHFLDAAALRPSSTPGGLFFGGRSGNLAAVTDLMDLPRTLVFQVCEDLLTAKRVRLIGVDLCNSFSARSSRYPSPRHFLSAAFGFWFRLRSRSSWRFRSTN
jgi:hypothetical protein